MGKESEFNRGAKVVGKTAAAAMNGVKDEFGKLVQKQDEFNEKMIDTMEKLKDDGDDIKAYQYGIRQKSSLDELEKLEEIDGQLLVGWLLLVGQYYAEEKQVPISEAQQTYLRNLCEWLLPSMPSCTNIDAIERISKPQVVLEIYLEYVFLARESFDVFDENDKPFQYVSHTKAGIEEWKKSIITWAHSMGKESIIDIYKSPESTDDSEDGNDHADNKECADTASYNREQMEELIITDLLHIKEDETKTFSNKILHFDTIVICDGNLVFDNCVVYYHETGKAANICLKEKGKISFIHCDIICCNYVDSCFITCEGHNSIQFKYCNFKDCSYMVDAKEADAFCMDTCQMLNCLHSFVSVAMDNSTKGNSTEGNSKIVDCKIIESCNRDSFKKENDVDTISSLLENATGFLWDNDTFFPEKKESSVFSCEGANFLISNITIDGRSTQIRQTEYLFQLGNGVKIQNCTFTLENACLNGNNYVVSHCYFDKCKGAIACQQKVSIQDCSFNTCTDAICLDDKNKIADCIFQSCQGRLVSIKGNKNELTLSTFCNIINSKVMQACIEIWDGASQNRIEQCMFKKVKIHNGFLISRRHSIYTNSLKCSVGQSGIFGKECKIEYETYQEPLCCVARCIFKSCMTKEKNDRIIAAYDDFVINDKGDIKEEVAIEILSCNGLDKVNKEKMHKSEDIPVTQDKNGNKIGAVMATVAAGALGMVTFGPIGAGIFAATRWQINKKLKI